MLTDKELKEYLAQIPEERHLVIKKLRETVLKNIPNGFEESAKNGMLHYDIPLSIYPDGYHCTKNTPLPFVSIASQKNFVALYHMGLYADKMLLEWFQKEYPKHSKYKLNMGKSCIRFKKIDAIPYDVIGQLMTKITVDDFIYTYEKAMKK